MNKIDRYGPCPDRSLSPSVEADKKTGKVDITSVGAQELGELPW